MSQTNLPNASLIETSEIVAVGQQDINNSSIMDLNNKIQELIGQYQASDNHSEIEMGSFCSNSSIYQNVYLSPQKGALKAEIKGEEESKFIPPPNQPKKFRYPNNSWISNQSGFTNPSSMSNPSNISNFSHISNSSNFSNISSVEPKKKQSANPKQ